MPTFDPMQPFTTAEAAAAGISPSQLRGSGFRRLAKGRFVSAARRLDAVLEVEAALLGHPPEAFACHLTAANVYRMPVPHDVVAPRRGLGCVGKELYSPEELVAVCAASGEDHAGKALTAARSVRRGVDSPMESRLRMLIVLAGLPEPAVNHIVRDELGNLRRRFDLCYPDLRLIVEYDGRQHADDPAQHEHDIERREELDRNDWRIVVVTAKGVYQRPEDTLQRVRTALRERGAAVPPRLRRDWRHHFPARPGPA